MPILGIDYGQKKIGLALATSRVAEPLLVIRFTSLDELIEKLREIVEKEGITKIIVGVSEGKMAQASKNFGQILTKRLKRPVFFQDETLTTKQAQKLSLAAGIKRKKRRELEDAYSAALILQDYLESQDSG